MSTRRSGWFWQERTQTTLNQWKVDCSTLRPTSSTAGKYSKVSPPVFFTMTHMKLVKSWSSVSPSCHLLAVKGFSCLPSGVTWTWLKFWCFVTSSGSCCQWSSSPGPPGSLCLDWVTCLPASFFYYLGPSYWSNRPGPASPCGTVSSSIMWPSLYLKICYQ